MWTLKKPLKGGTELLKASLEQHVRTKSSKKVLDRSKKDLGLVTGLFTRHCQQKYELSKICRSDIETCRCQRGAAETTEHLPCECQTLFCEVLKFFEGVK